MAKRSKLNSDELVKQMIKPKKNQEEEKEKKRKAITIYISEELDRVLSIEAAKKEYGKSKSDIVTIALEKLFQDK